MGAPDLLFLAHRIPYPPDKGDKIRSFHFLEGLSRHYRVHLGAFIDDPQDLTYVERLRPYCHSLYLPRLRPWMGQLRGVPAALRGAPLSLARYENARFARWVGQTLQQYEVKRVFAFSSAMGRYGLSATQHPVRRVMDFVDVDSEKWRQYADQASGPMRLVYDREHRTLAAEETYLAAAYDTGLFVSEEEARLFRRCNPGLDEHICAVGNGVDLGYFNPALPHADPFPAEGDDVVFTGAMDYQANVDGVVWFCREVWPRVRTALPSARFHIVGQRPAAAVRSLEQEFDGVTVTGRVPDVRPYLAHAGAVCAPLRVARGVQNKVLEALAMDRPVVGTEAAWEGLGAFDAALGDRVDEPDAFARALVARLQGTSHEVGVRRRLIGQRFSWAHSLEQLLSLLEGNVREFGNPQQAVAG
jgi:sugar transferase (PEP-CTERM/EpsH1 system associated)